MADDNSFSDWESVDDFARNKKEASASTEAADSNSKPKVVVELPPGGILCSYQAHIPDPPHQKDSVSSIGNSLLRNMGA